MPFLKSALREGGALHACVGTAPPGSHQGSSSISLQPPGSCPTRCSSLHLQTGNPRLGNDRAWGRAPLPIRPCGHLHFFTQGSSEVSQLGCHLPVTPATLVFKTWAVTFLRLIYQLRSSSAGAPLTGVRDPGGDQALPLPDTGRHGAGHSAAGRAGLLSGSLLIPPLF